MVNWLIVYVFYSLYYTFWEHRYLKQEHFTLSSLKGEHLAFAQEKRVLRGRLLKEEEIY